MKKIIALLSVFICVLSLVGGSQQEDQNISTGEQRYTYEELSEMPAEELLDLFIQNGLVINDDLKVAFADEELQAIFKENFHL